MVQLMKRVAKLHTELSVEERNLLSVAYKNVIGSRRASWRIVSSLVQKEEREGGMGGRGELIKRYRGDIEKELRDICSDILQLLSEHLLPTAVAEESRVFYYKM